MTQMFNEIYEAKFNEHKGYTTIVCEDGNECSGAASPFHHYLKIEFQLGGSNTERNPWLKAKAVCYPGGTKEQEEFLYSVMGEASEECCKLLMALWQEVHELATPKGDGWHK